MLFIPIALPLLVYSSVSFETITTLQLPRGIPIPTRHDCWCVLLCLQALTFYGVWCLVD